MALKQPASAAGAQASAAVDYGAMWDAHHSDLRRLAKEAGIPTSWMRVQQHRPTSRDDFIHKIATDYYGNFDSAAPSDLVLPNCVGLGLAMIIRSGLHTQYRASVKLEAVFSAILASCPEMLEGGIQPSAAIQMCNDAHSGRGLLIPGASPNTVYWVHLTRQRFGHCEWSQAVKAVKQLSYPALAITVIPSNTPPLHAMVTKGARVLSGNVESISAFDIQSDQGQNEANITVDDFHELIVCNISASEKSGRNAGKPLKPVKRHRFGMGCFCAQKDEPCDLVLQDSLDNAQRILVEQQEKFGILFDECEAVIMGAIQSLTPGKVSMQSVTQVGMQSVISAAAGEAPIRSAIEEGRRRLVERLDEIMQKCEFDEETLQVNREGVDDILRYILRKKGMQFCMD